MDEHAPRKRLALLIADPGSDYSQSVITGVRDRCAIYDYDLLVFSTMVKVCHPDKLYLTGDLNIFNVINYDLVDGVLVSSLSLVEDQVDSVLEKIEADIRANCSKPVVALDFPFADHPIAHTDDRKAIRQNVEHLVRVHGCKKLYMLTGPEGNLVGEARAEAFCEQMQAEGLGVSKENVFYGNFWYTSGDAFGERLLSGELPMPEAVVCANDFMAIGLANRLVSGGVKVPEQVLITGYDATKEAFFNTVSITTYVPDVYGMAAHSVDMMHSMIDPQVPAVNSELTSHSGLRIGASCGCKQDVDELRCFEGTFINPDERKKNADGSLTINDMQGLHESYMFEKLSVVQDREKIISTITDVAYLLQPYRRFYLVLRSDWSDTAKRCVEGYPETMRCVIRAIPQNEPVSEDEPRYSGDSDEYSFPTEQILPALDDERDEPVVFYFLPSHFSDDTMGYAVLQTSMSAKRTADEVSTLWLRNVNNSLHMVRIVSKLTDYSIHDSMTGLLNRRGMEMLYEQRMTHISPDDDLVIWMIDMDCLKYINDNFGHEHGDVGIIAIADAMRAISGKEDILARIGGDEFVIIASGRLNEKDGQDRIKAFEKIFADKNSARKSRPYDITASIGCVCFHASEGNELEERLKEADLKMYEYKKVHKKRRGAQ